MHIHCSCQYLYKWTCVTRHKSIQAYIYVTPRNKAQIDSGLTTEFTFCRNSNRCLHITHTIPLYVGRTSRALNQPLKVFAHFHTKHGFPYQDIISDGCQIHCVTCFRLAYDRMGFATPKKSSSRAIWMANFRLHSKYIVHLVQRRTYAQIFDETK